MLLKYLPKNGKNLNNMYLSELREFLLERGSRKFIIRIFPNETDIQERKMNELVDEIIQEIANERDSKFFTSLAYFHF